MCLLRPAEQIAGPQDCPLRYERWASHTSFLERRVGLGLAKRRLATLDEEARAHCLDRVKQRLVTLDPADVVERDEIVFAAGLKAGWGGPPNDLR